MSLFYRFAYLLGFTPWESAAKHGATVRQIHTLMDRETELHPPGHRRAVDLGCGTGHWSRELARRGWDVTGVDLVPRAVETARRRTAGTGLSVRFVQGDITRLRDAGITGPIDLFWDFGALHGLSAAAWQAAGHEITAMAAPDAAFLLMAWSPGNRGLLPRGAGREQIETALPDWTIVDQPFETAGLPNWVQKVRPRWYRLSRSRTAPNTAGATG